MNRNLKLVLLALLGFSPACSTVKTSRSAAGQNSADTIILRSDTLRQMIRVMYGVRPPVEIQEDETRRQADSLSEIKGVILPTPKDSEQ